MKLVFLLGNIGAQYRGTRHNIAWDIIDSAELDWSEQSKFRAYIARSGSNNDDALYVRPTTLYNEAGTSLRAVMNYYKIDIEDVLVLHDDLMLPLGTVRSRVGGRDAGNNGLKSIAQHVGDNIARIRIGIATDRRTVMGDTSFVLGKFDTDERKIVEQIQPRVAKLIDDFLSDSFVVTTYRHDFSQ